jgi:transcriptional regulator with XRE-family HTH domain
VQPSEAPPNRALARRLRELRKRHWPDLQVTQKQIAEALGSERPLSLSLISSWESAGNPVAPPAHRLAAYARFFASPRSIAEDPAHLLEDDDLTDTERAVRDALYQELISLRFGDTGRPGRSEPASSVFEDLSEGKEVTIGPGDTIGGGTWFFGEDAKRVVIVCARLPEYLQAKMPYTDKDEPDYVQAYTYADVDALIELFGHIRAVNPLADVRIRTADRLVADDYSSHLVLLGGVDWNPVTRDLVEQLGVPIHQRSRPDESDTGYFEVGDERFEPVVDVEGNRRTLREDVAHFFRGVNPANHRRTVTLCNGMFGRGTYGAVRALTDRAFRNRNEQYIAERFGGAPTFSILSRVAVFAGETLTPDWTIPRSRLHEWSNAGEPDG